MNPMNTERFDGIEALMKKPDLSYTCYGVWWNLNVDNGYIFMNNTFHEIPPSYLGSNVKEKKFSPLSLDFSFLFFLFEMYFWSE